ncbi:uncharacterized protein BDW70DRAFT_144895 [Aspergillus foveolatus]|uniref:uncharacterized protein n=1 Tax=Aspergillus foveolatus TaxID=210207 RepID=UPI003CCD9241
MATLKHLLLLVSVLAVAQPSKAFFTLKPRHEGHDHDSFSSSDDQGVGHNHSMSHGAFNFTPSGIPWPTCTRDCCNQFFEFFQEPVNHPLCVSEEFYANVTACIAESCTPYEQGAFAVVAEIECPEDEGYTVEAVAAALEESNGQPQSCEGVENRTIVCDNATATGDGVVEATPTGMSTHLGLERAATVVWGVFFLGAFSLLL